MGEKRKITAFSRIPLSNFILLLALVVALSNSWGYTEFTWGLEAILLAFLGIYILKMRNVFIKQVNLNWLFFWLFVLLRCLLSGNLISISTITVALYIGLFLVKFNVNIDDFYIKFLKIVGLVEAIGVYFQLFFNKAYNSFYQAIFTEYAFNWIESRYELYNYLSGFTSEVSKVAGFLAISLGAYIYTIHNQRLKKIDIISIGFIMVALILTGKRSQTFFSLLGIIIVYLVSARNREKVNRIIKVSCAMIALVVAMIYIYIQYGETNAIGRMMGYVFSLLGGEKNTFGGRSEIWAIAIQLLLTSPLIGIGWNKFTNMTQSLYGETINSAHNVYLQLFCELGIIGVTLFLLAGLSSIIATVKRIKGSVHGSKIKRNYNFLLYLYVFYFSYCFFGNCLNDLSYSMIFFPGIIILQNRNEIEWKKYC